MAKSTRKQVSIPFRKITIKRYGYEVKTDNTTTYEDMHYGIVIDFGGSKTSFNCEENDILKRLAKELMLPNTVEQVKRLKLKTVSYQVIDE